MNNNRMDALLNPSLEKHQDVGQPFSSTAHFILAWFGGGIASALFCCLSAQKMGLLKKKGFTLIFLLLLGSIVTIYLMALKAGVVTPPFAFDAQEMSKVIRTINQAFGVVVYGLFYLQFRRYLSAARLSGESTPSPWLPGIVCVLIGIWAVFAASYVFTLMSAS